MTPKCPTFFFFCFIIVQKSYRLAKFGQMFLKCPTFPMFLFEKIGTLWGHALYKNICYNIL